MSEGSGELFEVTIEEDVPGLVEEAIERRGIHHGVLEYWNGIPRRGRTAILIASAVIIALLLLIAILIPVTQGPPERTRSYYILATSSVWDYSPEGYNKVQDRPFTPFEEQFATAGGNRIGSQYTKGMFVGYEDEDFKIPLNRTTNQAYQGLLGPIIRGEVGQTLSVTVFNDLPIPITFFISGLSLSKSNGGLPYADGSLDNTIQTGENRTFVFELTEADGPPTTEPSSIVLPYYSAADSVRDINTGLVGMAVIYRKGTLKNDSPTDVGMEGFLLTSVFDESASYFLEQNIQEHLNSTITLDYAELSQSNRKYSINGYLYGNMPSFVIPKDQRIRWYVCNLGQEEHNIIWTGPHIQVKGEIVPSLVLSPGTCNVANSVAAYPPGIWLIQAFGSDTQKGMSTLIQPL
jgi:manganese oxidase